MKGVKYMATEGNSTLDGEHTIQYTYGVLLNCILKTYMVLLTNDTPIKLIKKTRQRCKEAGTL